MNLCPEIERRVITIITSVIRWGYVVYWHLANVE